MGPVDTTVLVEGSGEGLSEEIKESESARSSVLD